MSDGDLPALDTKGWKFKLGQNKIDTHYWKWFMLNIFTLTNGRLFQEEIESLDELSNFQPIWVDLESPTPEEKYWIQSHYGVSIPADVMDEDIEESARFYKEDNVIYM